MRLSREWEEQEFYPVFCPILIKKRIKTLMTNYSKKMIYSLMLLGVLTQATKSWATDYSAEALTATQGRKWYSEKFIPLPEEIEGSYRSIDQIKIRLPLDLERIISEHKTIGKPISIAVSCGDRELPWRANIAALLNNPSKPTGEDYNDSLIGLDKLQINHQLNSDNYLSIDPCLGIRFKGQWDTGRGAGHFVMDAMDPNNWQDFCDFLKQNELSVHQMIFTAGMGSPQESFEAKDGILSAQLQVLAPFGKLIEPYFFSYDMGVSDKNFDLLKDFPSPILNCGEFILYRGSSEIGYLFRDKKELILINDDYYETEYKALLRLTKKYCQGLSIDQDIDILIAKKYSDSDSIHKIFLKEMATYFISIVNLNEAELWNDCYETKWEKQSLQTQSDQLKNIIPIYLRYFKMFEEVGLTASFITSPQLADIVNIPAVKGQDWKSGDYPYGERDFIALVLEKN